MNQLEILGEFILQTTKKTGAVSFGQRAKRHGYSKVFGPNANPKKAKTCHISVEHAYPAVSVSAALAAALGATTPRRGKSAGPKGGRFQHDILLSEATTRYGTAEAFVKKLVEVAKAHNVW